MNCFKSICPAKIRTGRSGFKVLPKSSGPAPLGGPDGRTEHGGGGMMKNDSDYLNEFLRDVRRIFPDARLIEADIDGEHRPVKCCVICGAEYLGWPESEYCGNECASAGDRKYENPSKKRTQYLRQQCRFASQRATDHVEPETFEAWLRNFEQRIERMREQSKPNNGGNQNDNRMME
jgi:hypothetical protein